MLFYFKNYFKTNQPRYGKVTEFILLLSLINFSKTYNTVYLPCTGGAKRKIAKKTTACVTVKTYCFNKISAFLNNLFYRQEKKNIYEMLQNFC